jgi:hypothetical protein
MSVRAEAFALAGRVAHLAVAVRTAAPCPAKFSASTRSRLSPNASDYDCVGGSGNGPYYTGQVRVLGVDHFDLDRDGDGIGCD